MAPLYGWQVQAANSVVCVATSISAEPYRLAAKNV